jgi:predicted nucleic acid-binding Zn ribbon protein
VTHLEEDKINKIVEDDDINYIHDQDVIDDTLCPKCMRKITDDKEFCECGFYIEAFRKSSKFAFVFFMIVVVAIAGVILIRTDLLSSLGMKAATKITKKEISFSASPVIQVQAHLKDAGLYASIRDIYQQDYKNPNILIVVIKPERWPTMNQKQKDYIYNTILDLWKEAYKGDDPQVRYANPS